MDERDAVALADRAATVDSLTADLGRLGVKEGMTVMVHSSLSRLGFVAGGAQAMVTALLAVVGTSGTVMMPSHSGDLSDPASWSNPPVPESWWDEIRSGMPAFDPALTPTRRMGAIVECFRHTPGARRSSHPTVSAVAVGPNAAALTEGHSLECGLGEGSPQARLYDLDGHILLLGVTHANNTSLHLAEYRTSLPKRWVTYGSPILVSGARHWVTYKNLEDDDSDFAGIGDAFKAGGREMIGPVGAGTGRLMRSQEVVDFAVEWMNRNRRPIGST